MLTAPKTILALDVGSKRVGLALASITARMPQPLTTLLVTNDDSDLFSALQTIIDDQSVGRLVVGLPRGLQGQQTAQTAEILAFTRRLQQHFQLPIDMQDEALTSRQAEEELRTRGKPYTPADIDALAATYILEDWLSEHKQEQVT